MGGLVLVTFIPTYYAVDLGLGLSTVGFIFVLGRLLDVITDPLIGYFSDRTQSRFGPRRPWMIAGTPLFCFAVWMLFCPPETVSLTYLIIASALYFLFYTVLDVPYSSVGLEISSYVHERSTLASTKAIFQVMGAIIAAFIPFVFALKMGASLELTTKAILILCFIGLILFLIFVPRRYPQNPTLNPNFTRSLKTAFQQRPYKALLRSFLIVQSANSLTAGLTVLFVSHIIGTPDLVGLFMGLVLLSSALFLPLWVWISKRWSKKKAWSSSIILCAITLAFAPFFNEGDVITFAIFCIIIGGTFGCDAIMPTSMLADIVYMTEKSGKGRLAALFLAIKNSASKLTFIVPMGLAFPAIEYAGFMPEGENTPKALFTLIFFYAFLPIFLRIITFLSVQRMSDTEYLEDLSHG